ncbi:MAG: hypothetical protein ACKOE6_01025 [Flammeovirgaceae bacterium]
MEEKDLIKKSYFNLLSVFFEQESISGHHVRCLLKWGIQLGISTADLERIGRNLAHQKFQPPSDEVERLEWVYHLVYMIQLDLVLEDEELEVATIFAERLGFKKSMVADLFKSITTAESADLSETDVRKEVIDFLKIENN